MTQSKFKEGRAKIAATATFVAPDPDDLLTSAETAALVGIKNNTLETWRGKGKGKGPAFVKFGTSPQGAIRYRRGDVADWIEKQLYASTSQYSAVLANLRTDINRMGDVPK